SDYFFWEETYYFKKETLFSSSAYYPHFEKRKAASYQSILITLTIWVPQFVEHIAAKKHLALHYLLPPERIRSYEASCLTLQFDCQEG
ncbi:11957_t:CDS:2, partial [Racocetra persica]